MQMTSIWHWFILAALVLVLYGAGKIPKLMGDMASGIKAFKKGEKDDEASAETAAAVRRIQQGGMISDKAGGKLRRILVLLLALFCFGVPSWLLVFFSGAASVFSLHALGFQMNGVALIYGVWLVSGIFWRKIVRITHKKLSNQ